MVRLYIEHQREVVFRRAKWELGRAKERLHIVEGLVVAVENIDEVVEIIKSSEDTQDARRRLEERFGITPKQSEAITSMRLSQLPQIQRHDRQSLFFDHLGQFADLAFVQEQSPSPFGIMVELVPV